MRNVLLNAVAAGWLAGMLALFWAVAWVEHHWDHSPLTCAPAYSYDGLTCGRPLSTVLLAAGLVTLIASMAVLITKLPRH